MSSMVGGSEARFPLRALWRGLAALTVASGAFAGFGVATASAQICITLDCISPTPLPTVQITPLPTLSTVTSSTSSLLNVTSSTSSLLNLTSSTSSLLNVTSSTSSLFNATSSTTSVLNVTSSTSSLLGGTATTTSSTTSSTSDILGGLVNGNGSSPGQSCVANVLGVCVLPSSSSCPVGSTDPSCIVQTANPGCTSNCSPGGGGGGGGGTTIGGGGGDASGGSGALPTGTFSAFGGSLGGGNAAPGGSQAIPLGLAVAQVPAVQQLSPVSGLQFGHALILWPLFGLLDVLGLAAVCLVVRRFRVRSD